MNHEKKRADGVSKELKKVMKENTQAMSEFEKALQRKVEECNMLYEKVNNTAAGAAGSGGAVGTGGGDGAALLGVKVAKGSRTGGAALGAATLASGRRPRVSGLWQRALVRAGRVCVLG